MPHYDEATLALLALGETDVTDDNAAHLSSCPECQLGVDSLRAVVSAGRDLGRDYAVVSPPAQVWTRIAAELDVHGVEVHGVEVHGVEVGGAVASPMPTTPERDERLSSELRDDESLGEVVAMEPRRSRSPMSRWISLGAAAAVGLILGAGGMWALGRSPSQVQPVQPVQLASASLAALDIPDTSGTAVLQVKSANQRALTVNVSNLPLEAGKFYEVWLMDPLDKNLVALGVLGVDGRGAYVVPAGLDLSQYTAVDVSLQPFNGSPLHSSVSAVRGIMKA